MKSVALFTLVAILGAGCTGGLRKDPIKVVDGGSDRDAVVDGGGAGDAADAGGGGDAANDGGAGDSLDMAPDACVSGRACALANPCHVGAADCSTAGIPACIDTNQPAPDGTECGSGMACHAGTCDACSAGAACALTGKPCRKGTTLCTTGAPECTESDNEPNGTPCGGGQVCMEGVCSACSSGAACTPADPCHQGHLTCVGSTAQCDEADTLVAAGTPCGTDKVCSASGTCVACVANSSCQVADNPCRVGTTACNVGAPVCIESGNGPNGVACGTNMVCNGGSCVACVDGLACTPAIACHAGKTVCSPSISCTDSGSMLPSGTSCGTDKVCSAAGACVSCAAGTICQPSDPCKTGVISCTSGAPVCMAVGNAPAGTGCGTNKVCTNGACVSCTAGTTCAPTNPCHKGTLACDTGVAVCTDTAAAIADGTTCGANLVCRSGMCVSCTAGTACQPANPCKNGTNSCSTGSPVCMESTNKQAGTACGTGMVCNAAASCVACAQGGACTPGGNLCHKGTYSCSTGAQVCADGGAVADGTNCGSGLFCRGGMCAACMDGATCQPSNPCKTGTYSCATGSAICTETGNKTNGQLCGAGQSCTNSTKTLAAACSNGSCVAGTVACPNGCTGTDCTTCAAGQTSCSNGCKNLSNDVANCGACGSACPPPLRGSGTVTCGSSQCDVQCAAGLAHCTNPGGNPTAYSCAKLSWDFEDGTTDGFAITRTDFVMTTMPSQVVATTTRAQSGTHSLAIPAVTSDEGYRVEVDVAPCPRVSGPFDGATNATGKTLSAWFYLDGQEPAGTSLTVYPLFIVYTNGGSQGLPATLTLSPSKTWFKVQTPVVVGGDSTLFQFGLYALFNQTWSGIMYVDNVVIQ